MSGLIDKETALKSISWDTEAYNAINMIPAVDVVRCRDCKWWNGYYRECESPNWNTGTEEYIVQPAGMFCGWGERKSWEDPSHPCADSVMIGG